MRPRPPDSVANNAGSSASRLTVMRCRPASRSACACAASRLPLVVSARSSMPSIARQAPHQVGQALAQQRFAAGQAQLARAQPHEAAHQRFDLVEGQARGGIEAVIVGNAIGRHAVRAAEIAGVDHRQAQVAQRAAERVARRGRAAWSKGTCAFMASAPCAAVVSASGTTSPGMRDAMPARFERRAVRCARVVVEPAAREQFARVFALEIVDAAVRGIAVQRAIVEDEFAGIGVFRQLLGDRPRVAGPREAAAQAQAEAGVRPVVARREHLQPHAVVPEVVADRHQLERVPEIRAAFGEHIGIRRRRAAAAAAPAARARTAACGRAVRRPSTGAEQALEAADVVEVGVGQEQRARRLAVLREVMGESVVAAVDREPRRAVALDRGHRRAEFGGEGIADALQAQGPGHVSSPCPIARRRLRAGARIRFHLRPRRARRAASAGTA